MKTKYLYQSRRPAKKISSPMMEGLEDRTLMTVLPVIDSALADNRGKVTLNVNKELNPSTVNTTSVLIFTAGPSGNPANSDHIEQTAKVSFNTSTKQIVAKATLTANTAYEVVVKSGIVTDNGGHNLDGEFNGAQVPSGNGVAGGKFDFVTSNIQSPTVSKVAVFYTSLGQMNVALQPKSVLPQTITNFLAYANAGDWDGTFVHRQTVTDQDGIGVTQAGGFNLSSSTQIGEVPNITSPSSGISLETGIANSTGTIAMARTSDPNSATNEFFFNYVDNSSELHDDGSSDTQSYCAFGTITNSNGLATLDAIASLTPVNLSEAIDDQSGTFEEVPTLNNASADQLATNLSGDLVFFNRIAIKMTITPAVPSASPQTVASQPATTPASLFSNTAIGSDSAGQILDSGGASPLD